MGPSGKGAFAICVLGAAGLGGCTFDAGRGFATIERASLRAELEPGSARDLGDHTILTQPDGYHVRFEELTLQVQRIRLLELRGGSGGDVGFDPANPPPGFSSCHGGHCHAADGSLVSYEEVQQRIGAAAGASQVVPLVTICAGGTEPGRGSEAECESVELDVRAGEAVELEHFDPMRELPMGTVSRVEVMLGQARIEARVTAGPADGGLGERQAELRKTVAIDGPLTVPVQRAIGDDTPQTIALDVELPLRGTLFDDVDFAALEADGQIELGVDATEQFVEALLSTPLETRGLEAIE